MMAGSVARRLRPAGIVSPGIGRAQAGGRLEVGVTKLGQVVRGEPGFEGGEGFGHVAAPVTEANVVRLVVHGTRKQKNAGLSDELFTEGLHVLLRLEKGEADSAGVGRGPFEEAAVASKEGTKLAEITKHNLEIAVDEFLAMAESEGGEEFAGGAGANGGVVLEGDDFLEERTVVASEPAETQTGKAVGFADGAETKGAFVAIASGGKA